ncbi:hypothetical protein ACJ6WD_17420 [Streptomyces sp. VTCC 41912]
MRPTPVFVNGPQEALAALTTSLAPYRDQARSTPSRAAAMPGG